jgi:hypothetical protein
VDKFLTEMARLDSSRGGLTDEKMEKFVEALRWRGLSSASGNSDCQSPRILLDSAQVGPCCEAPQLRRSRPNRQKEFLCELQAFNTARAADVVFFKSRPSFSRKCPEQVRFSYCISIDGAAINDHSNYCD